MRWKNRPRVKNCEHRTFGECPQFVLDVFGEHGGFEECGVGYGDCVEDECPFYYKGRWHDQNRWENEDQLLPCPFCGSEAELASDFEEDADDDEERCQTAVVKCLNPDCRAYGKISDSCGGGTEQDAIDGWNNRST